MALFWLVTGNSDTSAKRWRAGLKNGALPAADAATFLWRSGRKNQGRSEAPQVFSGTARGVAQQRDPFSYFYWLVRDFLHKWVVLFWVIGVIRTPRQSGGVPGWKTERCRRQMQRRFYGAAVEKSKEEAKRRRFFREPQEGLLLCRCNRKKQNDWNFYFFVI